MTLSELNYPFGFLAPKDFKLVWLSYHMTLIEPDGDYSINESSALSLVLVWTFTVSPPINLAHADTLTIHVSVCSFHLT